MYTYFVSYYYKSRKERGYANDIITTDVKMDNNDVIREVEAELGERYGFVVLILNFKLLERDDYNKAKVTVLKLSDGQRWITSSGKVFSKHLNPLEAAIQEELRYMRENRTAYGKIRQGLLEAIEYERREGE